MSKHRISKSLSVMQRVELSLGMVSCMPNFDCCRETSNSNAGNRPVLRCLVTSERRILASEGNLIQQNWVEIYVLT